MKARRDVPISSAKLIARLRSYLRRIEALDDKLDTMTGLIESLAEDVGDDLLFLEREVQEFKKKAPKLVT